MKTILHIFPDSLFIDGYMSMLSGDKKHKHYIILTDIGSGINTNLNKNDMIIGKVSTFKLFDFIKLKKYIKTIKYDEIIIHSCYLNFLLLSFVFDKKILKKSILSLWGGQDCQKFKVPKKKCFFYPMGLIYELLRKTIYKNVHSIVAFMDSDYNSVKNAYKLKCPRLYASYPFIPNVENKDDGSKKTNHKDPINIQVCHSGSIHANTLDTLDMLVKYKDENIRLYAILSYDDKNNCIEVEKKGKELFGDKFIPITDYMTPSDYAEYISNLDIMISNAKIQQGLGNIHLGFASGVKLVFRDDGVLKENFENQGYIFNTFNELSNNKEILFSKLSKTEKDNNYNKAIHIFNTDEALENWVKVFDQEV